MAATVLRRFDVDAGYVFGGYDDRQKLYLDRERQELLPNTEIWQDGALQMRVNSLACKGPEIDPDLPVIAFVGDSSTMGHGFSPDSWPLHVEVPGYTNLNAAIEGMDMRTVATRWERLRERVDVACLVVYVGWHNIVYNETGEQFWSEHLSRFLGSHLTAFCTISTSLMEEFRTRGVEQLLNRDQVIESVATHAEAESLDGDYYGFYGVCAPADYLGPLLDEIPRYNAFLIEFARRHGATLIDLHSFLRPQRYEDAPRDFFDAAHIRPRAYPKVGRFVADHLIPMLEAAPTRRSREAVTVAESGPSAEDPRANIYPIW